MLFGVMAVIVSCCKYLVTGNSRCHAFDTDLPPPSVIAFPVSCTQIGANKQNRIHYNCNYSECYFFDLILPELPLSAGSHVFAGFVSIGLRFTFAICLLWAHLCHQSIMTDAVHALRLIWMLEASLSCHAVGHP